jgi:hypothetical protein
VAVVETVLSEVQHQTLEAVCDTVVPSVPAELDDAVMGEFLARAASEMGVAEQIEGLMAQAMAEEQVRGFADLLDGLAQHDFASLPLEIRTQIHPARRGGLLA